MPLVQLQEVLSRAHRWYPPVPTFTGAWVGGVIATLGYGIAMEVTKAETGGSYEGAGFGAGKYLALEDPALMLECVQAYNDYQVEEWCAGSGGRLIPLIIVPLWDPELAAAIGRERGTENSRARLEHAENAIQRAIARQTLRYESSMIFLASIVSGAPFMGLFGTVWGVMTAFSAISVSKGGATIADLAPGVTAALFTTIMGLVVAIPSVFGYNYLLGTSKRLITELENFASSLADRIELESQ